MVSTAAAAVTLVSTVQYLDIPRWIQLTNQGLREPFQCYKVGSAMSGRVLQNGESANPTVLGRAVVCESREAGEASGG